MLIQNWLFKLWFLFGKLPIQIANATRLDLFQPPSVQCVTSVWWVQPLRTPHSAHRTLHPAPNIDGFFQRVFHKVLIFVKMFVTRRLLCTYISPSVPRTQAKVLMSALLSFQRSTEAITPWPQFYKATAAVVRRKRQQRCVGCCTV